MTRRLYLTDPYVTSFEADVVEIRETDDGPAVVFGQTYFYPESGGQPCDLGTIDGIPVIRVVESDDETVLHFVERRPAAARVRCEIDADRRRDHMQQHCGQHILSAAFVSEAGAHTTSFHLGRNVSTIDLDKSPVTAAEIERAEKAANAVVRRAARIHSSFVTGGEARELDLRKAPPEGETLRIVEIDGFDHQACCGTHPRSSSEVGPIVVRSVEKVKGGARVEFLCGDRALADYRTSVSRLRSLASILSSAEADLVETTSRLCDERRAMSKELATLRSEALLHDAESWMEEATEVGGRAILVKRALGTGPAELRVIAQKLSQMPGRVILVGSVADGRAHLVFARSSDLDDDMGSLLREAASKVGGRGGGSPQIAQGGGPDTDGLDAALERARHRLVIP